MAKILVAEDERDIRDLVDFTLKFAGHEVHTAVNGLEALELAPKVMPDLILLDVRMPHMTGYEACRALKQLDTVRHIPVVFLSAKGQDVEMKAGLEAGAVDYILKPFAPDDLARRVAEILQQYAAAAADVTAADSAGTDAAAVVGEVVSADPVVAEPPAAAGVSPIAGEPGGTTAGSETAGELPGQAAADAGETGKTG